MIRVAVVDDHAAVRLGLEAALNSEWGLVPVGAVPDPEDVPALVYRTRPDVVLLDYHLPRHNGLVVCRSLKDQPPAPAVLLYSAYADAALVVPAIVAGADGITHKGSPSRELFEAIRTVARGDSALPAVSPDLLEDARDVLAAADRPILDLLLDHTDVHDIAGALQVDAAEVRKRIARMLERLKVPVR